MAGVSAAKPKELLSLGSKPLLQWAIEEAIDAGAEEIIVVTSPRKPEIDQFVAEARLRCRVPLRTVIQVEPVGFADAIGIACCDDDAMILLPDTLFYPSSPMKRLSDTVKTGVDIAIAAEEVAPGEAPLYGIFDFDPVTHAIHGIVEKPAVADAPSRYAVGGRFALSRNMMGFLRANLADHLGTGAETPLTPILNAAISEGLVDKVVITLSNEVRWDCGKPTGYLEACRRMTEPSSPC